MNAKKVYVAVAVIHHHDESSVLISKRDEKAHQGGLWEFPGGKIEVGETDGEALIREIREEVGLDVDAGSIEPCIQIPFDYGDKRVQLQVYHVRSFDGVPEGKEGQAVRWVSKDNLGQYAFPEANKGIVTTLRLPSYWSLANTVPSSHAIARRAGIIFRDHALANQNKSAFRARFQEVQTAARRNELFFSVNVPLEWFTEFEDENIHLSAYQASRLHQRPIDETKILGVSVHDMPELEQALRLKADYVLLSPILETRSHPGEAHLGWEMASTIAAESPVPVFGLGGLSQSDWQQAKNLGMQGVAGIGMWQDRHG